MFRGAMLKKLSLIKIQVSIRGVLFCFPQMGIHKLKIKNCEYTAINFRYDAVLR